MNPYLELLRPVNFVMSAIAVWLGYALGAGVGVGPAVVTAMLAAALVSGGGQSINDYFDRGVDAKKDKGKPIPSGRVKPGTAKLFSLCLFAAGIALASLVNTAALAIAAAASLSLYAYSAWLAKKKWLGNWVVAGNTGALFVFGATITGGYAAVIPLALAALFANVSREIVKDVEDLRADKGVKESLAVVAGEAWAGKTALFALLAACVFASLPALNAVTWFLGFVALADLAALYAARLILVKDHVKAQKWLKKAMILFMVAYASTLFA